MRDPVPVQHLPDELADAAVAGDDDPSDIIGRRRRVGDAVAAPGLLQPPREAAADAGEGRDQDHRQGRGEEEVLPDIAGQEPRRDGAADDHEGELAARTQEKRRLQGDRGSEPEEASETAMMIPLTAITTTVAVRIGVGASISRAMSRLMPTDTKNTAEQQALEGLHRRIDGAAVFRLGQEEPGDERAERHRQPAHRGDETRDQHHEEAGGHEEFGTLGGRDELEQGAQHEAPEPDDDREREGSLEKRDAEGRRR